MIVLLVKVERDGTSRVVVDPHAQYRPIYSINPIEIIKQDDLLCKL
jgi:hypothetical protein